MEVRKRKDEEKQKYQCRHCKNSYNWHEKNWKGDFFMCYCDFHKEGKFSKLLSDRQCDQFILREGVINGGDK
jgi:hypothetical protein